MSKIIKSARVVLGEKRYSVSAEVTAPQIDAGDGTVDAAQQNAAEKMYKRAENKALAIIKDAERQAEEIINKAEEDAAAIAEDAIRKAKTLYDNKRSEAQEEGYAQGFDAGQSEAQVLIDEALMIKEEWVINRNRFISRMEKDIVELCTKTVGNVINREIRDEAYMLDLIKKGIDHLTYTASLVVRVSEYDYDYVVANRSKILAMVDGVEAIEVKRDLALDHTDCVIDTDTGSIDVGIESQLERVRELFNSMLAGD